MIHPKTSISMLATGLALTLGASAQEFVPAPASASTALGAPGRPEFQAPVRLVADGQLIQVESPGYASPCWADVDRDGKKDLVVGQFNGGKMKVYRNLGDGKFAKGEWLEAGGKIAEVPGVW